jgi:hypothetical protein
MICLLEKIARLANLAASGATAHPAWAEFALLIFEYNDRHGAFLHADLIEGKQKNFRFLSLSDRRLFQEFEL